MESVLAAFNMLYIVMCSHLHVSISGLLAVTVVGYSSILNIQTRMILLDHITTTVFQSIMTF
jgi:hypothetical protein